MMMAQAMKTRMAFPRFPRFQLTIEPSPGESCDTWDTLESKKTAPRPMPVSRIRVRHGHQAGVGRELAVEAMMPPDGGK